MKISIFNKLSYKEVMRELLSGSENRGQLTKAAETLGCQRSYLSRVISESLHLTPDHAFRLSQFFGFTTLEQEYFMVLVDLERAGDPIYKEHLEKKRTDLKSKHDSIPDRTQRKSLVLDIHKARYFSSWIWSALHFLVSIPQFQTLESLTQRLGLKAEVILNHLKELEAQGFIERKNDRWIYKAGEFHAEKDSPLVLQHHQNWRGRGLLDAQENKIDNVHYTGVQTLSFKDYEKIKDMLLTFIEQAMLVAHPSEPEEAMVLTCDLFKV